jgi:small-conductance mechanosensitive channel/CRP-like cAMP-binding protein
MAAVSNLVRLVVALAAVVAVGLRLASWGGLPIGERQFPPGTPVGFALALGIVWWFALALAVGSAFRLSLDVFARMRRAREQRVLRFTSDAVTSVLYIAAAFSVAKFVFAFPLSTLFATSSVLAVVLGLAFQSTLGDLLSGFSVIIEAPFHVGDWIAIDEHRAGRVIEMTWRATHIVRKTGDVVIIPNSTLNRNKIVNYSTSPARAHRNTVIIKLPLDVAPRAGIDLLLAAAIGAKGVAPVPQATVRLIAYTDWALEYRVDFYFADWMEEDQATSNVLEAIWTQLSWAGIETPVPRTQFERPRKYETRIDALLERVPIFACFDTAARKELAAQLTLRRVAAGERIIRQGDEGRSLFIVREGLFGITVADGAGNELEVARLDPGGYVGEASLLTGAPRNATVAALTSAAVWEIDKDAIEPYLTANPAIADMLAEVLSRRAAGREAALVHADESHRTGLEALAEQIRAFFQRTPPQMMGAGARKDGRPRE